MVACLSFNLLHYDRTTYFNFISHSVCSVLPFAKYYLYFIEPILKNFQYLPASLNLFDGRQNNNNITNIANNKSFFCWIGSLEGIFWECLLQVVRKFICSLKCFHTVLRGRYLKEKHLILQTKSKIMYLYKNNNLLICWNVLWTVRYSIFQWQATGTSAALGKELRRFFILNSTQFVDPWNVCEILEFFILLCWQWTVAEIPL